MTFLRSDYANSNRTQFASDKCNHTIAVLLDLSMLIVFNPYRKFSFILLLSVVTIIHFSDNLITLLHR